MDIPTDEDDDGDDEVDDESVYGARLLHGTTDSTYGIISILLLSTDATCRASAVTSVVYV